MAIKKKKKTTKAAKTVAKVDEVKEVVATTAEVKKEVKKTTAGIYECVGGVHTMTRNGEEEDFVKGKLVEVTVKEFEQHILPFITKWKKV